MAGRVTATPAALAVVARLQAEHGPLVLFQSGGCCAGSAPMCLRAAELPPGTGDVRLGEVGGVPFFMDADQDARWGRPAFVVDVAPGAAGGFSLEALEDVHFVSRSPDRGREPAA